MRCYYCQLLPLYLKKKKICLEIYKKTSHSPHCRLQNKGPHTAALMTEYEYRSWLTQQRVPVSQLWGQKRKKKCQCRFWVCMGVFPQVLVKKYSWSDTSVSWKLCRNHLLLDDFEVICCNRYVLGTKRKFREEVWIEIRRLLKRK